MGSIRERAIVDADTKGAVDYMDYGIQLGRRFRALKAWMAIRAFGREGMKAPDSRALPARGAVRGVG